MNLTYEEILNNMKNTYFEECGENVDNVSELGKRFEAVASELFALSCYGDFILKQAFVTTASDDYLDMHGRVRGCNRKEKSQASGQLSFYLLEGADSRIEIPQGTVCSVEGKPYLQFVTTQDGVIQIGQTSVTVSAQSIGWGDEYNVPANQVTVMVNAPVGVMGVFNEYAFFGGYSDETDTSFRKRIIQHYAVPANAINAQSLENAIKNLDFVIDCSITYLTDSEELVIYVSTRNDAVSEEQIEEIVDSIDLLKAIGITPDVRIALAKSIDIKADIYVNAGYDKQEIKTQIIEILNECCPSRSIGESISLSNISKKLVNIDGVSDFEIYCDNSIGNMIYCDANKYLYINEKVVNCFDS